MIATPPYSTRCQMLMVECAPRSGLPLLFDGIIGQVEYDSMSNTHDCSHFPRDRDVGLEDNLMCKCWLSVDEITGHLGVNLDTIYEWITRRGSPASKPRCLLPLLPFEFTCVGPSLFVMNLAPRGIEVDFGEMQEDTPKRDLRTGFALANGSMSSNLSDAMRSDSTFWMRKCTHSARATT